MLELRPFGQCFFSKNLKNFINRQRDHGFSELLPCFLATPDTYAQNFSNKTPPRDLTRLNQGPIIKLIVEFSRRGFSIRPRRENEAFAGGANTRATIEGLAPKTKRKAVFLADP
jgi:hypothetical protein